MNDFTQTGSGTANESATETETETGIGPRHSQKPAKFMAPWHPGDVPLSVLIPRPGGWDVVNWPHPHRQVGSHRLLVPNIAHCIHTAAMAGYGWRTRLSVQLVCVLH